MSLLQRFIEVRRIIDNYWDHGGPEPSRELREEMATLRALIPQRVRQHIVGRMKCAIHDEDIIEEITVQWDRV